MGIIIRQSFKAAIFNYVGIALGFVSLIYILPLVYNPTELGALRLLIELGAVIGNTALLGAPFAIFRFYPYFKNHPYHNGFYFWAFLIPLIGLILVTLLYSTLKTNFFAFFTADTQYIQWIFPMLIFLIFSFMGQTTFEAISANLGRIAIPSFVREIFIRSIILLSAALYFYQYTTFVQSCWIVVYAYLGSFLINLGYILYLTPISLKPNLEFLKKQPEVKHDALKFTGWLFISSTATLFVNKVDFFMVTAKLSLADTAIYSIGFYIAVLIEIPKRNISQISTPILAEHLKTKNFPEVKKLYKQISNNQLLLGSLLFSFIWINIDTLFYYMPKGELYQNGKYVIFLIGTSKIIEMILGGSVSILNNSSYYAWNFAASIMGIISAIGLNMILIPLYGINGAALATLVTVTLLYAVMTAVIYAKMKLNPFSKSQLITGITLILTLSLGFFSMNQNHWVDSGIKTTLNLMAFSLLIMKAKVSPEMFELIQKYALTWLKKSR
jgi:O-antigen/teichoic acid export membrane protein